MQILISVAAGNQWTLRSWIRNIVGSVAALVRYSHVFPVSRRNLTRSLFPRYKFPVALVLPFFYENNHDYNPWKMELRKSIVRLIRETLQKWRANLRAQTIARVKQIRGTLSLEFTWQLLACEILNAFQIIIKVSVVNASIGNEFLSELLITIIT